MFRRLRPFPTFLPIGTVMSSQLFGPPVAPPTSFHFQIMPHLLHLVFYCVRFMLPRLPPTVLRVQGFNFPSLLG